MSRTHNDGKHWWRSLERDWAIGGLSRSVANRALRRLSTNDHLNDVASEFARQPLDEDFLDTTLLGLINEMANIPSSIAISPDGTFTITGKILGWGSY